MQLCICFVLFCFVWWGFLLTPVQSPNQEPEKYSPTFSKKAAWKSTHGALSDLVIAFLDRAQYVSVDVPATTIETDVTSDRYNNGQPALKLFTFPENASEPEGAKITR
jgi:hypothetical protein